MKIESASITVVTAQLAEARRFYQQHFAARPLFDCGWYVVLRLSNGQELCLMEPQEGMVPFNGGIFLNIRVEDADALHKSLTAAGLAVAIPLDDHPWGDRGFGVVDPAGVMVYCHHTIAPAAEFEPFFLPQD